ncbi:MAG: lipopolysaccharide heptosyltransferase II [Phycisphaerae bacterium]|nr:lipopolysaccharide heptosyltransferase II [Phycisphaerae bacterium]
MPDRGSYEKILIVQPSWVGDAVMATPTLRAIRSLYPNAEISYLLRRYVKPIYTGMPWVDQLITYRTGKAATSNGVIGKSRFFELAARLRSGKFDLAIVLPNSFKSALVCKMAGIPRVVGYDRDGRGFLLSDKLLAVKEKGKFVPTPIVKYYMGIARYLGGQDRDLSMQLFVTDSERREADGVLERAGVDLTTATGPRILLNPGAQYGAAKCWLPEYFAQLADRLIEERGATVLLSGSPREMRILDVILRSMKHPAVDLCRAGQSLGSLKEIVRRCDLMVTNDTGPRHIAAALNVPVVTLFGPTFPEWTEIDFDKERKLAIKVFCGPCQKKICPLDHRCMTGLTPSMVFDASIKLLDSREAVAK